MMTDSWEEEEFHFLNLDSEMAADEFLKRRLSYMRRHFSYENLSGLSVDELNSKIGLFNVLAEDTREIFLDENSTFAENKAYLEFITGEDCDLYDPLSENQKIQILMVCTEIHGNFDKAHEDARDRKFDRVNAFLSSLPMIGRLNGKQ